MVFKLRQNLHRHQFSGSNRTPNLRSGRFIVNIIRTVAEETSLTARMRGTISLIRYARDSRYRKENRVFLRASCPVTGRGRGTSRRFTIARTRFKEVAGWGLFTGLRKSSW